MPDPNGAPSGRLTDAALDAAILPLSYRNNRDYLRAADIFEALGELAAARLGADAYVSALVMRHAVTHPLRVSFDREARGAGTFALRSGPDEHHGVLLETNEPVLDRVPYDESRVAASVVAGVDTASCPIMVDGYSACDHLLAAIKAAGADPGREAWLCQIKLTSRLERKAPLAVSIRQRSLLFLDFEIRQDGRVIGSAGAKWRS